MMNKIKVKSCGFTAFSWAAAWMFTIGFLHLTFWKAVLAIVVWPYYLGVHVAELIGK